jgi:hypothetical protein
MQIAGRLHAGKHQFLERHEWVSARASQCHGLALPCKRRPL